MSRVLSIPISLVLFLLSSVQSAVANDTHKILISKTQSDRLTVWSSYMDQIGKNCQVKEDFFMGFDRDQAAYWSVDCNGSRQNGLIIQIPENVGAKARQMPCSVGQAMGVSCFEKMD